MKRYILPLIAFLALPLNAQNVVDAVRFGSNDITGTARYRSMAGAFGALGGDPSAMTDNPAGMGIFRGTSQISITPNLSFAHSTVDGSVKTKIKKSDAAVSNLGYVISFKTESAEHLVNFNVGVGFNHSASLERRYRMVMDQPLSSFGAYLANRANNALMATGQYSNPYYIETNGKKDPMFPLSAIYGFHRYAIDQVQTTDAGGNTTFYDGVESYDQREGLPSYQRLLVNEHNRNDEYNINFSANWDDFIYGGLSISIADFNSTINSEMNEDYQSDYKGNYTQYFNDLETKGSGVGIKAGILIKPSDHWRLGAAVHTPTWYHMKDIYAAKMVTDDTRCDYKDHFEDETYEFRYRYYSPWEYQLSTAWVLGNKGLLSLEYDLKDFTSQKYKVDEDDDDGTDPYADVNSCFDDFCALQHTFKAGAELRVTDHFSLRCGYAYKTSPYQKDLLDHPGKSRGWSNGYFGDDNTLLYDSSNKPNYTILDDQQYITAGMGWHGDSWFVDLSFMHHTQNELLAAYPTTDALYNIDENGIVTMTNDPNYGAVSADHVKLTTRKLNWDLTVGFRF
ncbi:MAG: hypothetical protein IJP70_03065 [Bacteroidales bacterium]|nr:hypothetical protein [Bacteroidales bacterium]